MKFINYAIDLGTTNSLIARSQNGTVQVFKNPKGFRESLPSVVAYRKNGILVGDKARELKDRDPKNVFSSFKRKMGTDLRMHIHQTNEVVTPIQLSTIVLNELKTFLLEEAPRSVVITIPASFDTVQSIATKEAGLAAGFDEVVLLQEPIAACLAVFNQYQDIHNGKWLIYDLGGGTFDVAVVRISEGELKVIDHLGNNFLGGIDFDNAIVQDFILPQLEALGTFGEVVKRIRNSSEESETQALLNYLLFYAEQLKIELTTYTESYVELRLTDDAGETQDVELCLTRDQFNAIIDSGIGQTIRLVKELMQTNGLSASDFEELVLVGGSTYSPGIREKIEEEIGIRINQRVDPTTAIVIGAAQYAANKPATAIAESKPENKQSVDAPVLIPVFESQTREKSELVLVKTMNFMPGFFFRVFRTDTGYDSGKVVLEESNRLSLPLIEKASNVFQVELYDRSGVLLNPKASVIAIAQGLFTIDGQPLPNDICIEVDDLNFNETKLVPIFEKNNILPLQKRIYKSVSRNMLASSEDELLINILEGDKNASPATNQIIGSIIIRPQEIGKNLIKDSDIEITLMISENRELSVSAYIPSLEFELKEVFNPSMKTVSLSKLREELNFLIFKCEKEKAKSLESEHFEQVAVFHQIAEEAQAALSKIGYSGEVASDTKFHVDEWKRQLSVKYDQLTQTERLQDVLTEYQLLKSYVLELSDKPDFSERLKGKLSQLLQREKEFLANSNMTMIREQNRQLEEIQWEYRKTNISELRGIFLSYKMNYPEMYTDPQQAQEVLKVGDERLFQDNVSSNEFYSIFGRLHQLIKPEYLRSNDSNDGFNMSGTGIQ